MNFTLSISNTIPNLSFENYVSCDTLMILIKGLFLIPLLILSSLGRSPKPHSLFVLIQKVSKKIKASMPPWLLRSPFFNS